MKIRRGFSFKMREIIKRRLDDGLFHISLLYNYKISLKIK